jgi:Mn-containing catalase
VFFHKQELQYKASPAKTDVLQARRMQELLGGQYGEITVSMQYMFQAWNIHIPGKYRDLLFGIGAEEMGHVEMLAVMIAQLLEKAPVEQSEDAISKDPTVAAVIGGMDVQHAIVAGAGARAVDSMGNPWSGTYVTASGNLLADFYANAAAEMQGRIQAARVFHATEDHGVRDLLSFLIARDTMHQNQWLAAAAELQAEGHEALPTPSNFPQASQESSVAYQYQNFSDGELARTGSWASGPSPDGKGEFSYTDGPQDHGVVPMNPPTTPDPRFYGTTGLPNTAEKVMGKVKDLIPGH